MTAAIDQLAVSLGIPCETLNRWLRATLQRMPYARYYVFRSHRGAPSAPRSSRRPRTIAAFPTADDAMAFAQRNGYGRLRLRSIPAAELLTRMLADPSIGSLMFLPQTAESAGPGWGPGLRLRRDEIVARLRAGGEEALPVPGELSARGYDALRFGVDFAERARFRVALAVAVEEVVAAYVPPVGSLDSGPRSIYATGAVEAWLRSHGFPHVFQRRWIDVAGDPRYGGAAELCELDAGTSNSLLVQLFIHVDDDGRQYIKRVNVTA